MHTALVFHETLFYGSSLDHSLINPNNLRHYGVQFWDNPYDMDHPLSIEVSNEVTIPLMTRGTKVLFRTFKPSQAQLEACPKIQINIADPWNPMEIKMGELSTCTCVPFCMSSLNSDHKVTRKYRDPGSDEALLHSVGTGCCHYDTTLNHTIEEM